MVEQTIASEEKRNRFVIVAGTYDTKGTELNFMMECLSGQGVHAKSVDLSTSGGTFDTDITPEQIADCHPNGRDAVFTGDRGTAVAAMTLAFENWVKTQSNIAGILSAGGSGGTALASPAMRALPIGIPKIMVSTVASGDVSAYVGPSDMMIMHSVTDISGINRISRAVLTNAANAMAGAAKFQPEAEVSDDRPLLGISMFGVTTPLVNQVMDGLGESWEPLVFHATGTGGQSLEKLVDDNLVSAALDLTTTEVCDLLVGGIFPATEDRFGSFIRTGTPWIGSVGALDMVNFGAPSTVPAKFEGRLFYEHNPQVTLMRTTPDENAQFARFIAERLNQMPGPVRLLLPENGVSALDAPGQAFEDAAARGALFETFEAEFNVTDTHSIIRLPHNINDPEFAQAVLEALRSVVKASELKE